MTIRSKVRAARRAIWGVAALVSVGASVATAAPASAASAPTAPRPGVPWGDGVAMNVAVLAPVSDGGSPITQYTYSAVDSSGSAPLICTGITTSCLYPDLAASTKYTYTVTAKNAIGTSPASAPVSFTTTNGIPGPPRMFPAGGVDGVSAGVSVAVPVSTGGKPILEMTTTLQPGGQFCKNLWGCSFTGLTPNTKYTYSATATTEIGTGPASASLSFATTNGLPGAPSQPTASWITDTTVNLQAFFYTYQNGGSPITGFTYTAEPGNVTCTGPTQICTMTGLTPNTAYTVTLRATNAIGTGPASASATFKTVSGLPAVWATAAGSITRTAAQLTWSQVWLPTVSSYTATVQPGGKSCMTTITTCTIVGLSPATAYTYSVSATNTAGTSVSNTVGFSTTLGLPSAPSAVNPKSVAATTALARWNGAPDGGYPITGYTVTVVDPTGVLAFTTCISTSTSCNLTGLTPSSTYSYTVKATNQWGTSAASAPSSFTTAVAVPVLTAPAAPAQQGALNITPVSANVTWVAPGNTGGSAITGYTATLMPGNQTCTVAATVRSCPMTGLSPYTVYTYTVKATNAIGTSPAGSTGGFTTLQGMPSAPTALPAANLTTSTADAMWAAPADDWGSPVTIYTITMVDITPLDSLPWTCTTVGSVGSCTFYNLTPGDQYTYTVTATNARGTSAPSAPITFIVPLV